MFFIFVSFIFFYNKMVCRPPFPRAFFSLTYPRTATARAIPGNLIVAYHLRSVQPPFRWPPAVLGVGCRLAHRHRRAGLCRCPARAVQGMSLYSGRVHELAVLRGLGPIFDEPAFTGRDGRTLPRQDPVPPPEAVPRHSRAAGP